jgi:hypothetical protein
MQRRARKYWLDIVLPARRGRIRSADRVLRRGGRWSTSRSSTCPGRRTARDPLAPRGDQANAPRAPWAGDGRASPGRRGGGQDPRGRRERGRCRGGDGIRHDRRRTLHEHHRRVRHDARPPGPPGRDARPRLQRLRPSGGPRGDVPAGGGRLDGPLRLAPRPGRPQRLRPPLGGRARIGGRSDRGPRPVGHHGAARRARPGHRPGPRRRRPGLVSPP